MSTDPVIGRRSFTDGVERDVCLDEAGQYVLSDDGEKVSGVWLVSEDEPAIVYAPSSAKSGISQTVAHCD